MFAPGWNPEPDRPWPERLEALLRSLGMTFTAFAAELGVDHVVLRRWMLGEGAPEGSAAKRIEALERGGMEVTFGYRETVRLRGGRQ